jgi:RNA polymerase sigma-70 factor (family 1)
MVNNEQIKRLFDSVCRDEEVQAYKELYSLLCSRLIHFSASIVYSYHLAEEIVSDVFVMVWQKRRQLRHVNNPLVYLYVSTKNLSLNSLQQQKKHQHANLDLLDVNALSILPDAEHNLISAEVSTRIEQAIRSLPARCQLIFRLIKLDGLSYKEVGALLEISPKTVDAQLAIAIKKISQAIRLDLSSDQVNAYYKISQ